MNAHYTTVAVESYHSLVFWMYYLRGRRREVGRALPPDLDVQLVQRVRRLYAVWIVEMRYRPDFADETDVTVTYDSVTWLRENRSRLWS